jgi:hypothetical protein
VKGCFIVYVPSLVVRADEQHFLSLPYFLPFFPSLISTFEAFSLSTPVNLLAIPTPPGFPETRFLAGSSTKDTLIQWRQLMIPSALGALLLNVITQGMCVRGVNRLTTVSILFSLSHEADGWRGSIQPLSTWS